MERCNEICPASFACGRGMVCVWVRTVSSFSLGGVPRASPSASHWTVIVLLCLLRVVSALLLNLLGGFLSLLNHGNDVSSPGRPPWP